MPQSLELNFLLADGKVANIVITVQSPIPLATVTIPSETTVTFPAAGGTRVVSCITRDQFNAVIPGAVPIVSSSDARIGVIAGPDTITITAAPAANTPTGGYNANIQVLP